jgi:hypothetical protein
MQKGEALHRALPLEMRNRSWIVAIIVIVSLVSADAFGIGAQGQPLRPGGYLDPFVSLVRGGYVLCHSSCAERYGIDDLHTYRVLFGARIERFALWAVWDACAHPLYRGDEIRLRICSTPFRLPASIALEPALWREAVKGFPAGYSTGLAAVIIFHGRGLAFSVRRRIAGQVNGRDLIACSARIDRLSLVAEGCWNGGRGSLVEVEGELALDGLISLRTGYRLDTGEIRCGFGCRGGGILVTLLWSHHPVLGRTLSLGVGYVWPR